MEKVEHLNEEKYQKTEKIISVVSLIILIIGLSIGGFLIFYGVVKPNASKLETLKKELEEKREKLEDKGVIYNSMAKYTDGESYDLMIITNALDPSFDHCSFSEYKNNTITKEYCFAKNSTEDSTFFGIFICIVTCMISFVLFKASKSRKIFSFYVQQILPVAQEGIEKMAPTIGTVGKEFARGISEGIKEAKEDEE